MDMLIKSQLIGELSKQFPPSERSALGQYIEHMSDI